MKKFYIFGLLIAFACTGENLNPRNPCIPMTFSDANPVQFWPIDCETWNESSPAGVHKYCFCQPFNCDDPIKIEFKDYNDDYILLGYDEEENEVLNKNFFGVVDPTSEGTPVYLPLSDFTNGDVSGAPGATAWTLGSSPSVTLSPVNTSKFLVGDIDAGDMPAGFYKISCTLSITSSLDDANSIFEPIAFLDGSDVQIAGHSLHNGYNEFTITLSDDVRKITFRFVTGSDGSGSVNVSTFSVIPLGAKSNYSATIHPTSDNVCDQKVILKIARLLILPELSEWENGESAGGPWTTGSNPSVTAVSVGYTDALTSFEPQIVTPGQYTFNFDIDLDIPAVPEELQIFVGLYNDAFSVGFTQQALSSGSTHVTGSVTVDVTGIPNNIRIQMFAGAGSYLVTLNLFELSDSYEYLQKSDCLDIKTSHAETLRIDYSNHTNYAGITYGTQTPDPSFMIRIPAVFFETRFPQEGEDFQTSSNQVIALNSQVKEQRLMSTDRMPAYMHRKILLILSHQFLYIDGQYWIKGSENYEKKEKSNKRDSLDMYSCWLTRADYVVRNIL